MEIDQEYFDDLGQKLLDVMASNILSEEEWIYFSQYKEMLCDDIFSLEQKRKVAVLVEDLLAKYQDVLKNSSDNGYLR